MTNGQCSRLSGSELICPLCLQLAGWPLQAQPRLPHSYSKWEELRGCSAPSHSLVCQEQTTNNPHSWKSASVVVVFPLCLWQCLLILVGFSCVLSCGSSCWEPTMAGHLQRSRCFLRETMVNKFLPQLPESWGATRAAGQKDRTKTERLQLARCNQAEDMDGFNMAN